MTIVYIRKDAQSENKEAKVLKGATMGTYYDIRYFGDHNYQPQIDSLFQDFNHTFSTYISNSEVSRINSSSDSVFVVSDQLKYILHRSTDIYEQSHGYFDPSVVPILSLWGFGSIELDSIPDQKEIDSVLSFCGWDNYSVKDDVLTRHNLRSQMVFNAIAKGYGVDVISDFLKSKGIQDFKVEIGGEVFCAGKVGNRSWEIAIESPSSTNLGSQLFTKLQLKNKALATSGNYRDFIEKNGVAYGHTIDPLLGKPAQNDMMSVSVIANDCLSADAWATAFMASGFDKSIKMLEGLNEIEVFFIYTNGKEIKQYVSDGFTLIK